MTMQIKIIKTGKIDTEFKTNVEKGARLYGLIGFIPMNRPVTFTCKDDRKDTKLSRIGLPNTLFKIGWKKL